jgi:hypothetical protein
VKRRWIQWWCKHPEIVRFVAMRVWGLASFPRPIGGGRCLRCGKVAWFGAIDEHLNFYQMAAEGEK